MSDNNITLTLGGSINLVLNQPTPEGVCFVTVTYERFTITAKGDKMAYTLAVDKQIGVQVAYTDSRGNPASIDGAVTWDGEPANLVTVTVDPQDSTKATVVPTGPVGNCQVTATADADLGAGTRNVVTLMDVTLVAGEAVIGTITPVGEAVPIPTP